jgi:hypothetical protein
MSWWSIRHYDPHEIETRRTRNAVSRRESIRNRRNKVWAEQSRKTWNILTNHEIINQDEMVLQKMIACMPDNVWNSHITRTEQSMASPSQQPANQKTQLTWCNAQLQTSIWSTSRISIRARLPPISASSTLRSKFLMLRFKSNSRDFWLT